MNFDDLRRLAVTQTLFAPTTLQRAIERLGFVQADPIRAPARAQDLILRQRVKGYRTGDLERRYHALSIEEDVFINYGFVTRGLQALMHPRPGVTVPAGGSKALSALRRERARLLLDFVREHGVVHPRQVDDHFAHGRVKNYWGGSSNATTQLLDLMHYRGLLRIARREGGVRLYAPREHDQTALDAASLRARLDALVDVVVNLYAPLPASSLGFFIGRLRYAVPQWRDQLKAAVQRARERLSHASVGGIDWHWPAAASSTRAPEPLVRLLAPFDPVVQDRTRFELLWGWQYRFEAYTPVPKRKLGYYALPLLWRDRVIGWGNLSVKDGALAADLGYASSGPPRDRLFKPALAAELDRMGVFLCQSDKHR